MISLPFLCDLHISKTLTYKGVYRNRDYWDKAAKYKKAANKAVNTEHEACSEPLILKRRPRPPTRRRLGRAVQKIRATEGKGAYFALGCFFALTNAYLSDKIIQNRYNKPLRACPNDLQ